MTVFEDWPAWVAFVTIIAAYAMGYFMGRLDSTRAPLSDVDQRPAFTRGEQLGFTFGMVAALAIIQSKTGPPSRSPPVSGTGQPLNPGQPTHSPPVAGAGGETG